MASLIDSFLRPKDSIKVFMAKGGRYVEGRFVECAPCVSEITGSVQQLRAHELNQLPEGRRNSEALKVYSVDNLEPGFIEELKNADEFEFKGVRYEVHSVEDWTDTDLPHFKMVGIRIDAAATKRAAR
jgi:hypothetical protein